MTTPGEHFTTQVCLECCDAIEGIRKMKLLYKTMNGDFCYNSYGGHLDKNVK